MSGYPSGAFGLTSPLSDRNVDLYTSICIICRARFAFYIENGLGEHYGIDDWLRDQQHSLDGFGVGKSCIVSRVVHVTRDPFDNVMSNFRFW